MEGRGEKRQEGEWSGRDHYVREVQRERREKGVGRSVMRTENNVDRLLTCLADTLDHVDMHVLTALRLKPRLRHVTHLSSPTVQRVRAIRIQVLYIAE